MPSESKGATEGLQGMVFKLQSSNLERLPIVMWRLNWGHIEAADSIQ